MYWSIYLKSFRVITTVMLDYLKTEKLHKWFSCIINNSYNGRKTLVTVYVFIRVISTPSFIFLYSNDLFCTRIDYLWFFFSHNIIILKVITIDRISEYFQYKSPKLNFFFASAAISFTWWLWQLWSSLSLVVNWNNVKSIFNFLYYYIVIYCLYICYYLVIIVLCANITQN